MQTGVCGPTSAGVNPAGAVLTTRGKMSMKIRPEIQKFAEAMENKLRKHDEERGETGWRGEGFAYLLDRLEDEVDELKNIETDIDEKEECVDIANFAMMIFDRHSDEQPAPIVCCECGVELDVDMEHYKVTHKPDDIVMCTECSLKPVDQQPQVVEIECLGCGEMFTPIVSDLGYARWCEKCQESDQQPQLLRDLVKKWCSKVDKAMSEGMTFDTFTQGFLYDFKNALIADQQSQDDLLNLLAIIHRDGGHYTNKHGLKKSVEDAKTIVSAAVQSQDQQPQTAEKYLQNDYPFPLDKHFGCGKNQFPELHTIYEAGQQNCNCQQRYKKLVDASIKTRNFLQVLRGDHMSYRHDAARVLAPLESALEELT